MAFIINIAKKRNPADYEIGCKEGYEHFFRVQISDGQHIAKKVYESLKVNYPNPEYLIQVSRETHRFHRVNFEGEKDENGYY